MMSNGKRSDCSCSSGGFSICWQAKTSTQVCEPWYAHHSLVTWYIGRQDGLLKVYEQASRGSDVQIAIFGFYHFMGLQYSCLPRDCRQWQWYT